MSLAPMDSSPFLNKLTLEQAYTKCQHNVQLFLQKKYKRFILNLSDHGAGSHTWLPRMTSSTVAVVIWNFTVGELKTIHVSIQLSSTSVGSAGRQGTAKQILRWVFRCYLIIFSAFWGVGDNWLSTKLIFSKYFTWWSKGC